MSLLLILDRLQIGESGQQLLDTLADKRNRHFFVVALRDRRHDDALAEGSMAHLHTGRKFGACGRLEWRRILARASTPARRTARWCWTTCASSTTPRPASQEGALVQRRAVATLTR